MLLRALVGVAAPIPNRIEGRRGDEPGSHAHGEVEARDPEQRDREQREQQPVDQASVAHLFTCRAAPEWVKAAQAALGLHGGGALAVVVVVVVVVVIVRFLVVRAVLLLLLLVTRFALVCAVFVESVVALLFDLDAVVVGMLLMGRVRAAHPVQGVERSSHPSIRKQ